MKKALLGVSILILIVGAGFAWSHYNTKSKRMQSEELFWQGRKALNSNDDLEALKLLSQTASQAPDNAEFNFWAGISAKKMGKKDLAYSYFEKSWKIGKKDPEVFINMMETSSLQNTQRSIFFENMANDIREEQARLELTALLQYQREELENAAQILKKLVDTYPEGPYAEFYAKVLMRQKKPEAALQMLEEIHKKGRLNQASYIILTEIYIAIDDMEAAKALYNEAISKGMAGTEVTLNYANGLFFYGGEARAKELLSSIKLPKLFSASDISSTEILKTALNGDSPLAKLLIANSNPALKQALSEKKTDRFSDLKLRELFVVALNNFCQNRDWFKPELLPAAADTDIPDKQTPSIKLSAEENFTRNARALALAFPNSLKIPDYNKSTHEARVILMMIASSSDKQGELEELLKLAEGSRSWLEGERDFGKYLLETMKEQGNATLAEEYFDAAVALLPDNSVVQINLADNLARREQYIDALLVFARTTANSLILTRSPMVLQMRSNTMIASGDLQGGENILIGLFKRGYITLELLQSLSRVALDIGDRDAANMALNKLEEYAVTEPRTRLFIASILLQSGNTDEAISELDKLLDSGTETELKDAALLLKARAELSINQAEAALKTLAKLGAEDPAVLIIKAQALSAINQKKTALEILENLSPLPEQALSLYAALLAEAGEIQKAKVQLDKILEIAPDNIEALTNMSLLQSSQGQNNEAIETLQRVLDLSPENIKANLLLAQLFLSTGNPTDAANLAITVLRLAPDNQDAKQILPSAYNAKNEYVKAAIAADRALQSQPDNPFITMQKAIALVGISNKIEREHTLTSDNDPADSQSNEELLTAEIVALTDDIAYTGVEVSGLEESADISIESDALKFARGRSSSELRREAITALDTIIDQPAALVYKLEIELMLLEKDLVLREINSGKLKVNELFSLGVIADRRKEWDISAEAYLAAYKLQPTNPIILNNYANAVVMSGAKTDKESAELLLQAAEDLPQVLGGDLKAVNTSAMIYNYLKKWDKTITLANNYPEQFKLSPKLNELLNTAKSELSAQHKAANADKKPVPIERN